MWGYLGDDAKDQAKKEAEVVAAAFKTASDALQAAQAQKDMAAVQKLQEIQSRLARQSESYKARLERYGEPILVLPSPTSKWGVLLIVGIVTLIGGLALRSRRKK